MGTLTLYLQDEFERLCPEEWRSRREARLLPRKLERLLGYSPQADVVLERKDGLKRVWIEFEISRADPVANHAKFATSHLFQPQSSTDVFIAMVSPHVSIGRRNLAANTVRLMRRIGMSAFQTVLFPHVEGTEIKRINHLAKEDIGKKLLDVKSEMDRAFLVSEPLLKDEDLSIYFAGDIIEVMLNLHAWNEEIAMDYGSELWGKRTVTYFVYSPKLQSFAPSKFCAYVSVLSAGKIRNPSRLASVSFGMHLDRYAQIDARDPVFDGARARRHLTRNLGMLLRSGGEDPIIDRNFERWIGRHDSRLNVHPKGPRFIVPPLWFQ